jgi:glycosyltransferase involved in cell wall biosynthesis
MKVAFNARLLHDPSLRGWNRYTINLLLELADLGVELFLYSDRHLHESHLARLPADSYQIKIAPQMPYLLWEQYWLPRQCDRDRVDILHCPFNFGLPLFSSCVRVLTLHDAIDCIYYDRDLPWLQKLSLAYLKNKLYHSVARHQADVVITVSKYSKQDLIAHLQIPEHKIAVTYEAADPAFYMQIDRFDRDRVRAKYQLSSPYIFYIGGWEARKNIPFLIRAFAEASLNDVQLILAGGRDEQKVALMQLVNSLELADRVKLLGWIDEEDLPTLYAEALCFVYPSAYEGFGLQICEAMAVGCPVLAANATCLPEILGDGGGIFSLADRQELVELLKSLSSNADRQDLVKRAKQRSHDFSWSETANQTKIIYQQQLGLIKVKN